MKEGAPPHQPHHQNALAGLAIIAAFNIAGLLLHAFLIPLPGAVIGLGLLAAALFTGLIKVQWVENGAFLLLNNMSLFFVPAIAGVLDLPPALSRQWLPILLAVIVSFLVVLLATASCAALLLRRSPRQ